MKKIILGLIVLLLTMFLTNLSYANFITYEAPIFNVEVQNINENIKSIWLCIYDESDAKISDAYKDSNFDFSKARVKDNYLKGDYAAIDDKVDPFAKEDAVLNLDYNKKDFYIEPNISYTYSSRPGYSTTVNTKFNNINELKDYFLFDDKLDVDNIVCERSILYSPKRLIELKEISPSQIIDGKLNLSISDFSELKEHLSKDINAGFALRFENVNSEYKTIIVGKNWVYQGSKKDFKADESQIVKNTIIDYISGKELSSNTNLYELIDSKVNDANTRNIIFIVIGILVLTIVAILIAIVLKKAKLIKIIIIISVIIAIVIISFYYTVFTIMV